MLIRPLRPPAGAGDAPVPAWQAVQQTMPERADGECWLITQADHAKLAGDIAAQLTPRLDDAAIEAIAVHDAGWKLLDRIPPREAPVSFFYVRPSDAAEAWRRSIGEAERLSPLAGLLVSGHFVRLASERAGAYGGDEAAALQGFLDDESQRQECLRQKEGRPQAEVEQLIDILQFCDLLSLYLCCGAEMPAAFPQPLPQRGIVIRANKGGFALHPTPFLKTARLTVMAHRYSPGADPQAEQLAFRVV